jgi:hypothetical protein
MKGVYSSNVQTRSRGESWLHMAIRPCMHHYELRTRTIPTEYEINGQTNKERTSKQTKKSIYIPIQLQFTGPPNRCEQWDDVWCIMMLRASARACVCIYTIEHFAKLSVKRKRQRAVRMYILICTYIHTPVNIFYLMEELPFDPQMWGNLISFSFLA